MRITIRPIVEPQCEIDVTHVLVSAIAEELYHRYKGSASLNWLEAERQLELIFAQVRAQARAIDAERKTERLEDEGGRAGSMPAMESAGMGQRPRRTVYAPEPVDRHSGRSTDRTKSGGSRARGNDAVWSDAPSEERRHGLRTCPSNWCRPLGTRDTSPPAATAGRRREK